jgi:glycosyltransferase involved in cell wall biosynthesis
MKVIHVIARMNQGGTAKWIETLTNGLRDHGNEVILLAGNVESNETEDSSFERLGGIRIDGLGRSLSTINDIRSIFVLRNIFKLEKPSIINTHTAKAGAIGRIASIGLPFKVVHTFHGHLLYGYFAGYKTKMFIAIERILALQTDFFISAGKRVRDELITARIGSIEKYLVIAPGRDIEKIIFREDARKALGIEPDSFVVGWLGRLVQIKRPDLLLELASKLPEVIFLVGGKGELFHLIDNYHGTNLIYVGWTDPDKFWPACDVALLTSDNEGLPTSLIEAALHSVPIIARNVGSVSEIFENDKGGYLVSDPDSIQDHIRLLNGDRVRLGILSEKVQKYATDKFSVKKFIGEHISLYEGLK